jgi:hypothetical protein
MHTKSTNRSSYMSGIVPATQDARLLCLTFWLILAANLVSSLYASLDARGLYSDGAAYLVNVFARQWFLLFDTRTTVQILRQAPIVVLSRYTSATLFECGQVFTFVMLSLPTTLCALCWFIAPKNQRAWILFPLASLLIGFAATSIHAIGEAAIATSYYWILLFLLLFRTRSTISQTFFVLLCIPAFRLHEGTFPLTAVLLLVSAMRTRSTTDQRGRTFAGFITLLLAAILTYQIRWVIYPQFPNDRESIVKGLTHFEFLYFDHHFNLPLVTGAVALLALSAVLFVYATQPGEKAQRLAKMMTVAWALFALTAIATAIMVEQSFSPFSQLQARYHPPLISAVLGTVMVFLNRFEMSNRIWMQPSTIFILISLCATQTVADVAATRRWNAYVADLQSRLVNGRGLIPWETTLHTANERADINWQLTLIGWVVPYDSIVYAPNGVVRAIISSPLGTTYRPLDPEQPDHLPRLRDINYGPYVRSLAIQKSGGSP